MCALRQPLWPASDKAGDELGRVVPRARTQPSDCCHDYTLAAATNARRGGAGTGAFEKVVGRGGGSRIALRSPDRNSPTSGWLLGRCRAARGPLRSPSGVGGPRVLRGCVRCGTDANARPRDGTPVIKLPGQAPRHFLASSAGGPPVALSFTRSPVSPSTTANRRDPFSPADRTRLRLTPG